MKKVRKNFNKRIAIIASMVLAFLFIGIVGSVMSDLTMTSLMAGCSYAVLPLFMIDGKFKELSEADFKEFSEKATAEELAGYLNALNAQRKQELKDLIAKGANENKEAIDKMKAEILEMRSKQVDVMEEALKKQGLTIQRLIDEGKEKASQPVIDQIKSELNKNMETLMSLKAGKRVDFTFSIKAVGTMLESTNITGAIPQYMRLPGVNFIAQRVPYILDLIGRGTTTSNVIEWVEEVAGEGAAGYTAEGVKKNQIDADFVLGSEKIQKLTVFVKVSEEMLADVDFMASYINDKLLSQKLALKLDAELLDGAGGGAALNGIYTQATAWAAGVFALAVPTPNNFDVLRTAINQIMIANFKPTVIVLHPSDVTKMKITKTSTGEYLFPTFIMPGGTEEVDGIRIVTNTGMTAGNFLVMDATKATAYFKEGINIKTGWESDDFVKNLRTILAEVRVANVIEGNDVTAFVKGDFASAILALTKP